MKKLIILHCVFITLLLLGIAGCSTTQPPPPAAVTSSASSKSSPTDSTVPPAKAKATESDSAALQGAWSGKELSADSDAPCALTVSGQNFEFHGPDPSEWYKGTFTLREDSEPKVLVATITECPVEKYVGKVDYAIFRVESGTLTLAAREPGNPDMPTSFDAPETRRFVFSRK